ncbi:MAG TPA: hypothetical protein VJ656_06105 [Pyrinomonadaceae bacterium]|nr:hypothetical protein [Pyrinomonadaceae bacterium]
MTITEVIVYSYAQTAATIRKLKTEAYKSTTQEKYAYRAPDGKSFRNKRPSQELIDSGWTYCKVRFQQIESCISPRHERWQDYQNAKRRASLLLAARLMLKANNETVPDKTEISTLIGMGTFRSHARTASAQKSLAFSSFRYLRKLNNRLRKQPQRFEKLETWIEETEGRHA